MCRLSIIALLFLYPYKQNTMKLIFVASALGTQHKGGTAKTARNQGNVSWVEPCDWYLSDLVLCMQLNWACWSSTKRTSSSSSSYRHVTSSRHLMLIKCSPGVKQQSLSNTCT
jgi:hypothetical protein